MTDQLPALSPAEIPTLPGLEESLRQAASLALEAHADRTRNEYKADWHIFEAYCGVRGVDSLPARPEVVVAFVNDHAEGIDTLLLHQLRHPDKPAPEKKPRSPSTVERRVAAIAYYHRIHGLFPSPTSHPSVRLTINGYAKRWAKDHPRKKKAKPVSWDDLARIVDVVDVSVENKKRLIALRDRALVLFGFATALRGESLGRLPREGIEEVAGGALVHPGVTKTDQKARGEPIPVPQHPDAARDPIAALNEWIEAAELALGKTLDGPVFRSFRIDGTIGDNAVSRRDVSRILAKVTEAASITGDFSSHSLRRGFLTSTRRAGAPRERLKDVSKHKSEDVLSGYIEEADALRDPALLYLK